MGLIKNNPKSIMLAWTGIIVVGFGTFAYAKDLVSNERRAENIRRIKRERREMAYGQNEPKENKERHIVMSEAGAENKRKRQVSIQGSEVLLKDEATVNMEKSDEEADAEEAEEVGTEAQATVEPEGSSPAKRPRTSEDGADEDEDGIDEDKDEDGIDEDNNKDEVNKDEVKQAPPVTITTAEPKSPLTERFNPVDATKTPVFGMTFASTRGLGGFAAAAAKPSLMSSFGSSAGGFAKYAKPKSPSASTDEERAPTMARTKTFEAMLTAEGKETLATNALLSAVVPAMAHTHVGAAQAEQVRTHEEDETCEFATKAKLFELAAGSWAERGGGQFRVNRHNDTRRCRLVMRTDQTFRLILNVPLFAAMKFVCDGRFIRFTCFDAETMAPKTFALRFPSEAVASEAHRHVSRAVPTEDAKVGSDGDAKDSSDEDTDGSSDGDANGSSDEDANGSSDEDAKGSSDEEAEANADEEAEVNEGSADKGKGKALKGEDDYDSEDDEDYEESGSESDDNVLDSDVDNTGSEADSDHAPAQASSSKSSK
ncbi:hypothetical protein GGH12_003386 [Coemansia sp. RSA 1822]|nr:hypothetical protein GGH12_003386 [Coemansia sp. RSA 1822]